MTGSTMIVLLQNQRFFLTNVSWLLDTRKKDATKATNIFSCVFSFAKGLG